MHTGVKLMMFAILAGVIFPSCVSKKKFTELMTEKDGLVTDLSKTKEDLASLEKEKTELEETFENEKARMTGQIEKAQAEVREKDLALENTKNELTEKTTAYTQVSSAVNTVFSAYQVSGLQLTTKGGDVVLSSHGPVHFNSGSTRVKREYFESLDNLATILQNNPQLQLIVVGHADNQQMKAGAGLDNRALSHARAMNVVRRLIRKGANPAQLSAVGRSDFDPIMGYTDSDLKEARKQNRRVEFVIDPKLSTLYVTPRG